MQNDMQITVNWSRLKPEVELKYGGRLYFETESIYISATSGVRYLHEIWFSDRRMQNNVQISGKWSKSKTKVDF